MASTNTGTGARDPGRPASRPLLPPAARPLAAVLVIGCVAVTSVLAAWFAHQTRPGWLDSAVDGRLYDSLGGHRPVLWQLVRLGEPISVGALTAALLLACLAVRRWRGAVLVAVAVPAAQALTEFLLKPLVGRTMGGGLSFPSGHTTGIFAFAAAFAVLLVSPARLQLRTAARLVIALIALLVAAAVAVALVALRQHYFTDTVGGAALSVAVVLVTALAIDQLSPSARPAAAAEPDPAGSVWPRSIG